jgi:hypothetical protein
MGYRFCCHTLPVKSSTRSYDPFATMHTLPPRDAAWGQELRATRPERPDPRCAIEAHHPLVMRKIVGLWGSIELTSYLSRVWFDDSAQGPIHPDAAAELMLLTRIHASLHPPAPTPSERVARPSNAPRRGSAWDDAWRR